MEYKPTACVSSPTSGEISLDPVSLRTSPADWCGNPPDERYSGTASLAPRIYEGGGPRSGRGSPPPQRGEPPQSRLRRASSPRGEAEGASRRSCPRIYEGGGPRSGRGSPPPQRGRPSQSRFACQLSQRESQGHFAPFLPPAFMRGEGHAVAGGVLRRSGDGPLSHGIAVPALPRGEPRELRSDHRSLRAGSQTGVRIPRMKGTAEP